MMKRISFFVGVLLCILFVAVQYSDAQVWRGDELIYSDVALNDVVVDKGAIGRMIEMELFIDGEFICSLRADGLNVAVFKQNRDATGNWVDAPHAGQTETDIENSILTRARQLRLSNIKG